MSEGDHLTPDEREDLVAYLDGELDDEATQRLETKLSNNPGARTEAEELKRSWSMLDYLPRPEASQEFTHRTLDKLAAARASANRQALLHRWLGGAGWAAGVVLAALGGYWAMQHWPHARPVDAPIEEHRLMERREYWHHFENVESIEFLRALERSELFAEDP